MNREERRSSPSAPSVKQRIWMVAALTFLISSVVLGFLLWGKSKQGGNSESVVGVHQKAFGSPEEAIRHYISALQDDDPRTAFEACAIYEHVANLDFEKYSDYLGVATLRLPAPLNTGTQRELNHVLRLGDLGSQTRMLTLGLVGFDEEFEGIADHISIVFEGEQKEKTAQIKRFIEQDDPGKLKDLKIIRMDTPRLWTEKSADPKLKEQNKVFAEMFGWSQVTERVVLYQLEKRLYAGGFRLVQYGDNWKIEELASQLAGIAKAEVVSVRSEEVYESKYLK